MRAALLLTRRAVVSGRGVRAAAPRQLAPWRCLTQTTAPGAVVCVRQRQSWRGAAARTPRPDTAARRATTDAALIGARVSWNARLFVSEAG